MSSEAWRKLVFNSANLTFNPLEPQNGADRADTDITLEGLRILKNAQALAYHEHLKSKNK